jgi:hypothetical protein
MMSPSVPAKAARAFKTPASDAEKTQQTAQDVRTVIMVAPSFADEARKILNACAPERLQSGARQFIKHKAD